VLPFWLPYILHAYRQILISADSAVIIIPWAIINVRKVIGNKLLEDL